MPRDGGFWSPQLELELDEIGYYSLISLPLGHNAACQALQVAAQRGAMKPLTGKLSEVRAARIRTKVGDLDRTLVVCVKKQVSGISQDLVLGFTLLFETPAYLGERKVRYLDPADIVRQSRRHYAERRSEVDAKIER